VKEIIGFVILALVCYLSGALSHAIIEEKFQSESTRKKVCLAVQNFFLLFVGINCIIAVVGAVLWVFAWIAIYTQLVLQWLIESLWSPYRWVLDLL